jgi:hypothetical protein
MVWERYQHMDSDQLSFVMAGTSPGMTAVVGKRKSPGREAGASINPLP